jgi:hypothetical protein
MVERVKFEFRHPGACFWPSGVRKMREVRKAP